MSATREAFQALGGARELVLTLSTQPGAGPPVREAPGDATSADDHVPALTMRDTAAGLVVIVPPADSPLLAGDVIVSIGGVLGQKGDPWARLAGPEGSLVDLEIDRPATGQRLRARLPRTEPPEDDCD
jgi:hypothetical protein